MVTRVPTGAHGRTVVWRGWVKSGTGPGVGMSSRVGSRSESGSGSGLRSGSGTGGPSLGWGLGPPQVQTYSVFPKTLVKVEDCKGVRTERG